MEKLYTQSAETRPGADCGSDHELLIAKSRLKLKKVGKTTRPFRYDLNQILYNYTEEVTNRFKGLDLIDRVPEELWTEVGDIVQEAGMKNIPKKKKCKKSKWLCIWQQIHIRRLHCIPNLKYQLINLVSHLCNTLLITTS